MPISAIKFFNFIITKHIRKIVHRSPINKIQIKIPFEGVGRSHHLFIYLFIYLFILLPISAIKFLKFIITKHIRKIVHRSPINKIQTKIPVEWVDLIIYLFIYLFIWKTLSKQRHPPEGGASNTIKNTSYNNQINNKRRK